MIFVVSRGRPEMLRDFLESCAIARTKDKIIVRLDEDDTSLQAYKRLNIEMLSIGPRIGVGASLNELFNNFPNEAIYALLADDINIRTLDWDSILSKKAGNWGVSYGSDLVHSRPSHPFIGGALARAVGYLSPSFIYHLGTDLFWEEVGSAIGVLEYIPTVVTEHLHWSKGKMAQDETYEGHVHSHGNDLNMYQAWRNSHKFYELVEDLKEQMNA